MGCWQLVLLCHEQWLFFQRICRQHGHRGKRLASAVAINRRIVEMEWGVCRSGLSGAARAVAFLWRRDFAPERTDEGG